MSDIHVPENRVYKVPVSSVKEGTKLIADNNFSCIKGETVLTVQTDKWGRLFVDCDEGRHLIDGEIFSIDGCDYYVGFLEIKDKT